ncbi:MAG: hypothetical protein ACRCSY_07740 [Cetobacterium sp.]
MKNKTVSEVKEKIYLMVTPDEYEIPLDFSKSMNLISTKTNIPIYTLWSALYRGTTVKQEFKIRVVQL